MASINDLRTGRGFPVFAVALLSLWLSCSLQCIGEGFCRCFRSSPLSASYGFAAPADGKSILYKTDGSVTYRACMELGTDAVSQLFDS